MLRWILRAMVALSCLWIAFWLWVVAVPYPLESLNDDHLYMPQLRAADGQILFEQLNPQATRYQRVKLDAVSPHFINAIISVEDQRFYQHAGIDGKAIARSLTDSFGANSIRSGASTITQQLVKNTLHHDKPRTLSTKLAGLTFSGDTIVSAQLAVIEIATRSYPSANLAG